MTAMTPLTIRQRSVRQLNALDDALDMAFRAGMQSKMEVPR